MFLKPRIGHGERIVPHHAVDFRPLSRSWPLQQRLDRDLIGVAPDRRLKECARVLKPTGRLSLVFSNSNGEIWAMAQRAIQEAGCESEPDGVCLPDKGQRSVKGLTSGYERV